MTDSVAHAVQRVLRVFWTLEDPHKQNQNQIVIKSRKITVFVEEKSFFSRESQIPPKTPSREIVNSNIIIKKRMYNRTIANSSSAC